MSIVRRITVLFVAALILRLRPATALANSDIFPPSPAAKQSIDFDARGFMIHGQREFISSGSIHFERVPRELWKDRLLKLKRSGCNTVETYVFWNLMEQTKGTFNFTGRNDLGAFLQTAQDVGLYAIVRVGPYVCAEWGGGGYPVWLRFEPDITLRQSNSAFLAAIDRYYEHILPIVAAHQIHRGGNVILVQLENEHPRGWGTEEPNDYFKHILAKSDTLGIEVPHFFSGLHHGSDPGGRPFSTNNLTSPWFSTETWVRWYDKYGGGNEGDVRHDSRVFWNIVAHGGAGFNVYMFHGGTNFDFTNDDEDAASYDYGAMLGQGGDLRPLYYRAKRLDLFTASFPQIFAGSQNAPGEDASFATGADLFVRKSPAGTCVFLENNSKSNKAAEVKLSDGTTLNLDPRETVGLLVDTPLGKGITIRRASARTLAVTSNQDIITWVVYAPTSEKGLLDLQFDNEPSVRTTDAGLSTELANPKHLLIHTQSSEDAPRECIISSGNQILRLLVMTSDWADRTWVVGEEHAQEVVVGPHYLGDFSEHQGKIEMTITRPYGVAAPQSVSVFGAAVDPVRLVVSDDASVDRASTPALSDWQSCQAAAPAAAEFDDSHWLAAESPAQMGADGDTSAYAWYRADVNSPAAGTAQLHLADVADSAVVFVNGKRVGHLHWAAHDRLDRKRKVDRSNTFPVDIVAGHNVISVFVSHDGLDKYFNYLGKLFTESPKGINGPVTLEISGTSIAVTGWRMHGGVGEPVEPSLKWAALAGSDGSPAFFRSTFNAAAPAAAGPDPVYRVTSAGLSRGSIWLNGHNIGRYPEKIPGLKTLYLPECWLQQGANSLAIFDEEGNSPADVTLVRDDLSSNEIISVRK